MPKTILIFSTAYLPLLGGAEIAVKELTDRLPADWHFILITARLKKELPVEESIGRVLVHRVGWGNAFDKYWFMLVGSRLAERLVKKPNLVWAIMASYAGFAALRFKKKHPSVPYLLTLQEGDSQRDIYKHVWWCWWYFKQIFSRANAIQAISNYLAEWARRMKASCPIEVIPNGVGIEKIQDTNSKIQKSGDTKVVVSVSRLVKKNGLADLIAAMQFLPTNVRLVLVGGGELEARLKSQAAAQGVADRVRFIGVIPNGEVQKYLGQADVFCRPSLSEGLGISFLEAMAAGVPLVATRIGGIPDFLRDGVTGLFCRLHDPKDIAEKIMKILSDQSLANNLRINARELVARDYSWDGLAVRMKKLMETVIS